MPEIPGAEQDVMGTDGGGRGVGSAELEWPAGLAAPGELTPMTGGGVCAVFRGRLADGRDVVVKRSPYLAEVEEDGLRALAAAGVPVPAVLGATGHVLVLEHVAGPADWAALGRAVARLHRCTAERFGWHRDNQSGRLVQHNGWCDSWATFYVERRVRVHIGDHRLPEELRDRLRRACDGPLPKLLPPRPPVSLTHGDLWIGNVVGGRWLVDPAVSYADRELDVASMVDSAEMPPEFLEAYQAEWPLAPGFAERQPALRLYQMLLEVRHFGETWVPAVQAILDHYGW